MSIDNILKQKKFNREDIIAMLYANEEDTEKIYSAADKLRQEIHGDHVFLRGIIEFSNYCSKNCNYCGINAASDDVHRYRVPKEEIIDACKFMESRQMSTVVLQSGEDPGYSIEDLVDLITTIKSETTLAITMSVGELSKEDYRKLKEAGADRYLLRYETSDQEIFKKCHPDDNLEVRLKCLEYIRELGFQVGSGILIGLPGQTIEKLAEEIIFLTNLKLDMIGCGPFIPDERTAFAEEKNPFDKEVFFKVISIIRLLNPKAHLPATTAFDAIVPKGRTKLLKIGANIFMPNATPKKYRKDYMLYPNKPCIYESGEDCAACIVGRLSGIGRTIGEGHGHSIL